MENELVKNWKGTGLLDGLHDNEKEEQLAVLLNDMANYMKDYRNLLSDAQLLQLLPLVARIYRASFCKTISIEKILKCIQKADKKYYPRGHGFDAPGNIDLDVEVCKYASELYVESLGQEKEK